MLTALDAELFPEDCEVVEIPLHNQWVYKIFKNGHTTLLRECRQHGYRVLHNEQIRDLDYIDVYLRNPKDRYVSGINSYIQFLQQENPKLDFNTLCWMATRYKFLNRHYLPQWHWLLNLNRYLAPTTKLRLRHIKDLALITDTNATPRGIKDYDQEFQTSILDLSRNMELWFHLDQVLLDLCGNEMTWDNIREHYLLNHQELYKLVCHHVL